jgi:hypothetical protein
MISRIIKRACFFRLFFFFLFSFFISTGQGINNLWLMGYDSQSGIPYGGTDLNFSNSMLSINYHSRPMDFSTTSASICDTSGNLLFYTNGIYIANRFDSLMLNGDNINPGYWTSNAIIGLNYVQSHIIIPKPGSSTNYYLFHCTMDTVDQSAALYAKYVYMSEIDMTQDNGKGAVIKKNIVLMNGQINQGGFTAVKHGNGRDWWLVCHQNNGTDFYEFLVTPDSIYGPYLQNIGSSRHGYGPNHNFSRDGSKYAIVDGNAFLDILDFDRCSGLFSNNRHIDIQDSIYLDKGLEFSPNGNFLYVSSVFSVYQYDLLASNVDSSRVTVAVWDSTYDPIGPPFAAAFRNCRLAPNGKIYISTGNSTRYLHTINQPDSSGLGCDLQQHSDTLPTFNFNSFPLHPNYFLGRLVGSVCDSLTGIAEVENDFHFNLFPNPNNGKFSISYLLPQNKDGTLEIFDLTGNIIYKQKLPMWSTMQHISIPNLADGVYLIKIISGNNSISKKLIVFE